MKLGIVGLPNVGKSTLFNALSEAGAQSANYPFCTIEPNIGIVTVPDRRLDVLSDMHNSQKKTPATIEFVDIAGLVAGASRGEGLGNKFLSHIREVDAIVHVVRCFEDDDIIHVESGVNVTRDVGIINVELLLADLESVEKRIDKATKQAKAKDKKAIAELELLGKIRELLEKEQLLYSQEFDEQEWDILKQMSFLTSKPTLFCANLSEQDFSDGLENNPHYTELCALARSQQAAVLPLSAKIEEELLGLPIEEKRQFLAEIGVDKSGLEGLVQKSYELLGLISYLTSGPEETRAWTITKGTKAPQAAGKIHSDFERGFIRAETIHFDKLCEAGSMVKAKELGWVRSEGKEYVVNDGDVVLFRFNV